MTAVGLEVNLHFGVRSDDRPDVASFDHDVAVRSQLPLALAHHLTHGWMPRDDGDLAIDARFEGHLLLEHTFVVKRRAKSGPFHTDVTCRGWIRSRRRAQSEWKGRQARIHIP